MLDLLKTDLTEKNTLFIGCSLSNDIDLLFALAEYQGPFMEGRRSIDWFDPEPMPLSVLDKHRRTIEAHWLVVQDGSGGGTKEVEIEPSTGVRDQCEAGGVRLREAEQRERTDRLNDLLLRCGANAVASCQP